MSTTVEKRKRSFYAPVMIIGAAFMIFFGYIVPPFSTVTELGVKMLGVLIGLIIITCFNGDMLGGSLLALLCTVFHGYYTASELLATWLGSTAMVQLVFCGALCIALRESGAMDVLVKKLLGNRFTKGRPLATLIMLFFATYCISIFVSSAPLYILMFGLVDSIRDVCGYKKDDPFIKFTLLGIYIGATGAFFFAWKFPQVSTIAMIQAAMDPYGMEFSTGTWMITQAVMTISYLVIYAILMKTVYKANLEPLSKLDVNKVEHLKEVPDQFSRDMKLIMTSIILCVAYIVFTTLYPKTAPFYDKLTAFGNTWIWVLAVMLLGTIRRKGTKQGLLPVGKLLSQSSLWMMIALVGSLTILGKVTSDANLGVRDWLIDILSPLFGNMNLWVLMAVVVLFATLVTQITNGMVLTMAICPVIAPFVCEMSANGAVFNPCVILTVANVCANVAYLTVAGSVNAAYLLSREEISQKFIWTKGLTLLCVFMVWVYLTGMALSYIL